MKSQCVVGSIGVGVCPNHTPPQPYTTQIMSGAIPMIDGQAVAIVTSIGVASCGCTSIAISGSASCTIDGLGAHRVGDVGTTGGEYVMVTGSPSITTGD